LHCYYRECKGSWGARREDAYEEEGLLLLLYEESDHVPVEVVEEPHELGHVSTQSPVQNAE
jgi:hypothetical protein